MENKLKRIRSLRLGRKSAQISVVATIIIVPIIMLVSHETVPDTDPMYKAQTPLVGVVYFPVVYFISWFVSYIVLRNDAYKREGL